jgi:hypothetical protein
MALQDAFGAPSNAVALRQLARRAPALGALLGAASLAKSCLHAGICCCVLTVAARVAIVHVSLVSARTRPVILAALSWLSVEREVSCVLF